MEKKIRELDAVLTEKNNASLKNGRQMDILLPIFQLNKIRELEDVLLQKYGIVGKGKTIGLAVLNLLEELNEKNDGEDI